MNKGDSWVKLYRKIFWDSKWISLSLEQKYIYLALIAMANPLPNTWLYNGEKFELKAGQMITSVKNIVEVCNNKLITTAKVRGALKILEKLEYLTIKTTNKNTLITILNWEETQGRSSFYSKENDKQMTNKKQTDDKQITIKKQTNDNQMTTNKNIKNNNNYNNYNNYNKYNNFNSNNKNVFSNYTQRVYSDEELEEILRRKSMNNN